MPRRFRSPIRRPAYGEPQPPRFQGFKARRAGLLPAPGSRVSEAASYSADASLPAGRHGLLSRTSLSRPERPTAATAVGAGAPTELATFTPTELATFTPTEVATFAPAELIPTELTTFTPTELSTVPAAPALPAHRGAPSKATTQAIPALIPAGAAPAVVVPTVTPPAPNVLCVIDHADLVERRTNAIRHAHRGTRWTRNCNTGTQQ
jgi:hypothetical protein